MRRARSTFYLQGQRTHGALAKLPPPSPCQSQRCFGRLVADVVARDTYEYDATRIRTPRQRRSNKMKLVLALAVGASAFGGFGKSAAPAPSRGGQVAQGGQTVTNIQVPKIFTTAFGSRCVKVQELTQKLIPNTGDPGRLQERAARAEAKKAEAEAQSATVRRSSPRATCRVVATNHCFRTQAHPHSCSLCLCIRPPGHPRRAPRRAPRKVAVERRVPRQGAPGPGQLRPGRRLRRRPHEVGARPDRAGSGGLPYRRRQAPVQAPYGPDLEFARRQRLYRVTDI